MGRWPCCRVGKRRMETGLLREPDRWYVAEVRLFSGQLDDRYPGPHGPIAFDSDPEDLGGSPDPP